MMVHLVFLDQLVQQDLKEKEDIPARRVLMDQKDLPETKAHLVLLERVVLVIKEKLDHLVSLELMDLLDHK